MISGQRMMKNNQNTFASPNPFQPSMIEPWVYVMMAMILNDGSIGWEVKPRYLRGSPLWVVFSFSSCASRIREGKQCLAMRTRRVIYPVDYNTVTMHKKVWMPHEHVHWKAEKNDTISVIHYRPYMVHSERNPPVLNPSQDHWFTTNVGYLGFANTAVITLWWEVW